MSFTDVPASVCTCGHADVRHTWKDGSRKLAPYYGRCEAKKCLCWKFVNRQAPT
jgi:hypothetical protein